MGLISMMTSNPAVFVVYMLAIIYGITIHEFSHCYTAYLFGDDSQIARGRLTLNPLKHIDPLGLLFLVFFGIGWGRTSIIDPRRINPKKYKLGMFMVSIAGILSNILSAFFFALLFKLAIVFNWFQYDGLGVTFFTVMIYVNVALATFNLIPIYPLDGAKILEIILPEKLNSVKILLANYGNYFLIALLLISSYTGFSINFLFEPVIKLISFIFKI